MSCFRGRRCRCSSTRPMGVVFSPNTQALFATFFAALPFQPSLPGRGQESQTEHSTGRLRPDRIPRRLYFSPFVFAVFQATSHFCGSVTDRQGCPRDKTPWSSVRSCRFASAQNFENCARSAIPVGRRDRPEAHPLREVPGCTALSRRP